MMTYKIRIALALCVASAAIATGSAPFAAAQEIDCKDPKTQTQMTICANMDWEAADAALNDAYSTAMSAMRKMDELLDGRPDLIGGVKALRAAQRAWIPYRDAACEAEGFIARGGTMEPMLVAQCRADLTRQRTRELLELANDLGT